MDVRGRYIHAIDEHFDKCVYNHFIIIVIAQFESVIKEDVSFEFVIIRIDNLLNQSYKIQLVK